MKNYFLVLLGSILLITSETSAQLIEAQEQWTAFFHSDVVDGASDFVVDMKIDASGNIYVTGESNGSNISTVKYGPTGNLLWAAEFSGAEPRSLEVDASGNVYVTGQIFIVDVNIITNYNIITIKYDASGNELWHVMFDGGGPVYDEGTDIVVDADGNVYVGGRVSVIADFNNRLAVVKYNSSGVEQWSQLYASVTGNVTSYVHVALDNDGNVYAGGTALGTGGANNFTDLVTLKFNSSGVLQWVSIYDDPESFPDELVDLLIDPSGYIITGGYVEPNSSAYDSDFLTVKYNPTTGAQEWVSIYDGGFEYDDVAYDFKVDASGNIYVVGYSYNDGNYFAVVKYNSLGAVQWVENAGTDYVGQMSMALDGTGNTYITGQVSNNKLDTDIFTYSFNSIGNLVWSKTYHSPANASLSFIAVDGSDNVIVSATSINNLDDRNDFITIKYEQVHLPVDDAIEDAAADVSSLPLGAGNKNALLSKLNNALAKYDAGDLNAAKNLLNAFINQLNQLVANGDLTAVQAQPLIDYVNLILGEINLLLAKTNVVFVPDEFSLSRNYPNPFNPSTRIRYDVAKAVQVELSVYNSVGEKVADLVNERKEPGSYDIQWNAAGLSSGVYFYRMKAGEFQSIQKMILMK